MVTVTPVVRAGCRIFARHVAHVGLVQTDWVTGWVLSSQEQAITTILTIMMPTMTKTSCRVLCLGLLLATRAFLVYCTSPTARANIKKARVASMPVPRKLLRSALVDLHHDEMITNDKWLTLEAIRKLIYTRFDFNAGIDFTVREWKKAANEVGPLGSKISQGNHAIVRSRMMEVRRKYFVNVAKRRASASRWMPCFYWTEAFQYQSLVESTVHAYAGLKIKPYKLHTKFPTAAEALQVIWRYLTRLNHARWTHLSLQTHCNYLGIEGNWPCTTFESPKITSGEAGCWVRNDRSLRHAWFV